MLINHFLSCASSFNLFFFLYSMFCPYCPIRLKNTMEGQFKRTQVKLAKVGQVPQSGKEPREEVWSEKIHTLRKNYKIKHEMNNTWNHDGQHWSCKMECGDAKAQSGSKDVGGTVAFLCRHSSSVWGIWTESHRCWSNRSCKSCGTPHAWHKCASYFCHVICIFYTPIQF